MNNLNGQPGRTESVRLRPYQQEAVQNLRARLAAGVKRLIIVAPTGSGKTTTVYSCINHIKQRFCGALR